MNPPIQLAESVAKVQQAPHVRMPQDPPRVISRISGTGSCLPEQKITNADLETMLDTTREWIESRTGIRERRIAAPEAAASDLALVAGRQALEHARLLPADVQMIIVATVTPDTCMPSTACWLQGKLKVPSAIAFDISAACCGFLYALSAADQFIRNGMVKNALVVGVDVFSRILNYRDRTTSILFGDGAGAVVLQADRGNCGIRSTHLSSDARGCEALLVPAGGSRQPASSETVEQCLHAVSMPNGKHVFRQAVKGMSEMIQAALRRNRLEVLDVDWLIPHQANLRIIEAVQERLHFPAARIFTNLDRYGNTAAASIPVALDEAVRGNRIRPGDRVMLAGFGAGFTCGSALIQM